MSLNGTCKQCKHWLKADRPPIRICGKAEFGDYDPAEDNAFHLSATANDDTGLACELITGPDFFCPHFEYDPARHYAAPKEEP